MNLMKMHKIEKIPVVGADNVIMGLINLRDIEREDQMQFQNKDEFG